jgi:hypothetical protein
MLVAADHRPPPTFLNMQLCQAWYATKISASDLAKRAKVSVNVVLGFEQNRGSLANFLRLMETLDLRLDIRTWEHRQLLPLEPTLDAGSLCEILRDYRYSQGASWWHWKRLTNNQRIAVNLAEANVSLKAFQQYALSVALHCTLVPKPADGS